MESRSLLYETVEIGRGGGAGVGGGGGTTTQMTTQKGIVG